MLAKTYRFHIVNRTGAAIPFGTANNSFRILAEGWKFDNQGALVYAAEVTAFVDDGSSLANGASLNGATQDNSSLLNLGLNCIAELRTTASVNGNVDVYVEQSTDGGTAWPSDSAGFDPEQDLNIVASVICSPSAQNRAVPFKVG